MEEREEERGREERKDEEEEEEEDAATEVGGEAPKGSVTSSSASSIPLSLGSYLLASLALSLPGSAHAASVHWLRCSTAGRKLAPLELETRSGEKDGEKEGQGRPTMDKEDAAVAVSVAAEAAGALLAVAV